MFLYFLDCIVSLIRFPPWLWKSKWLVKQLSQSKRQYLNILKTLLFHSVNLQTNNKSQDLGITHNTMMRMLFKQNIHRRFQFCMSIIQNNKRSYLHYTHYIHYTFPEMLHTFRRIEWTVWILLYFTSVGILFLFIIRNTARWGTAHWISLYLYNDSYYYYYYWSQRGTFRCCEGLEYGRTNSLAWTKTPPAGHTLHWESSRIILS